MHNPLYSNNVYSVISNIVAIIIVIFNPIIAVQFQFIQRLNTRALLSQSIYVLNNNNNKNKNKRISHLMLYRYLIPRRYWAKLMYM